ncbi:MAG TPA: hypothetical protein PLP66_14030, partial [Phycisphaerae bacterium]|nr:hypothetical protein [Phycisphaerae bacterium]
FERPAVMALGQLRLLPDLTIILLGVVPLTIFLFRTYPKLKAKAIGEGESVWPAAYRCTPSRSHTDSPSPMANRCGSGWACTCRPPALDD